MSFPIPVARPQGLPPLGTGARNVYNEAMANAMPSRNEIQEEENAYYANMNSNNNRNKPNNNKTQNGGRRRKTQRKRKTHGKRKTHSRK